MSLTFHCLEWGFSFPRLGDSQTVDRFRLKKITKDFWADYTPDQAAIKFAKVDLAEDLAPELLVGIEMEELGGDRSASDLHDQPVADGAYPAIVVDDGAGAADLAEMDSEYVPEAGDEEEESELIDEEEEVIYQESERPVIDEEEEEESELIDEEEEVIYQESEQPVIDEEEESELIDEEEIAPNAPIPAVIPASKKNSRQRTLNEMLPSTNARPKGIPGARGSSRRKSTVVVSDDQVPSPSGDLNRDPGSWMTSNVFSWVLFLYPLHFLNWKFSAALFPVRSPGRQLGERAPARNQRETRRLGVWIRSAR